MIKNIRYCKAMYIVIITSMLFSASVVPAEEPLPTSEAFSEGTKAFLSDPARAGSLLGTILAGAALTNPLAPMLGSVAGFFIGKNTDYSDKPGNTQRYASNNRSFIPEDGSQVPSLAGLTGKPLTEANQTIIPGLTVKISPENQQPEVSQPVTPELVQETGSGIGSKLQQQLTYACSNVDLTQPLPVSCYYYSQ